MARIRTLLGVAALAVLGTTGAGCHKTWQASTTQPNPLALPTEETILESEPLHIEMRDMEIPKSFKMRNTARFAVVSRDRLRFHVTLVHKWEEVADVASWQVRLEDDQGRVYYPEAKEPRSRDFKTTIWNMEQYENVRGTVQRNAFGDVVSLNQNGRKRTVELQSVDLFKGQGDYVFHHKDIFGRDTKRLTLIMTHGDLEYRFTWNFST